MAFVAKKVDPTFGRRLRELREAKGWTQAQLAERVGFHYQNVARLERGEREPVWGTALKLAEALGVTLDAFQGDE